MSYVCLFVCLLYVLTYSFLAQNVSNLPKTVVFPICFLYTTAPTFQPETEHDFMLTRFPMR